MTSSSSRLGFDGDRLLLDSLPYVDDPINDADRSHVQKLIEDEMRNFPPSRDYLAHMPSIPSLDFPVSKLSFWFFARLLFSSRSTG
jgi:hypothetical protein